MSPLLGNLDLPALGRLLGEFLVGAERAATEPTWLADFEGERLAVDLLVAPRSGSVQVAGITYLSDGVRQVAPSTTFDPISCARALAGALHREAQTLKGGQKS